MARFAVKALLLLVVVGGLVYVYRSDRILFEYPEERVAKYRDKLREKVVQDDVVLALSFDEPDARDWGWGSRVIQSGTESVPGRFGQARRFDGNHRTCITTALSWHRMGSRFTLSTWAKLDPRSPEQDIIYSSQSQRQAGLRLERGQMTFHVPAAGREQALTYAFERYNEFTHIVGVADLEAGMAYLYENGVLKASCAITEVDHPPHNVEFGKSRWYGIPHPLLGAVDETVLWRRALSPNEVTRLYESGVSVLDGISPECHRKLNRVERVQRGTVAVLKVMDAFNPWLHPGRARTAELPEINLYLSKRDRRHFAEQHRKSLESGRRVDRAARARRIHYVVDGRAGEASLRLHGSNTRYASHGRKAFVLELRDDVTIMGMNRMALIPPEDADYLIPLVRSRLAERLDVPHVRNGLCRLKINGVPAGVYYYEDFERLGVAPGSGADLFDGPISPLDWPSQFRWTQPPDELRSALGRVSLVDSNELYAIYDDLEALQGAFLLNDPKSPLSSREIAYRLKQDRRTLLERWDFPPGEAGRAEQAARCLTEFMLLGRNPSPFYLLEDLDLDVLKLPGVEINWRSSRPDLLAHDGRVRRPAGDQPEGVELAATITDGQATVVRNFSFRVMPQHVKIPAVMMYANEMLSKISRVDCVAMYYPESGAGAPRVLRAGQGTRGGLAHRGGTSYWERKKPFQLRLDEPHHLLSESATRHIFFGTGYVDATLMRNKLSYDIFRSMSEPGAPRYAPMVRWAEVFVNGRYQGLYEMGTRVDRHLVGLPAYRPGDDTHAVLYKVISVSASFKGRSSYAILQRLPRRSEGLHVDAYYELVDFILSSSAEELGRDLSQWMDVSNAIDFALLVNLVEGRDNVNVNFFLGRDGAQDARFFFVPFDFDKTFPASAPRLIHNQLLSRVENEVPAFRQGMKTRWQALRNGPLRADVLLGRVDEMEQVLAGYVEWDHQQWGFNRDRSQAELVETIRTHIRQALDFIDAEIIARAAVSENPEPVGP